MKFLVTNLYMKKNYWWHYELMEGPPLHLSLQNHWVSLVILIHNHFDLRYIIQYFLDPRFIHVSRSRYLHNTTASQIHFDGEYLKQRENSN